jgi:hypothetical protein
MEEHLPSKHEALNSNLSPNPPHVYVYVHKSRDTSFPYQKQKQTLIAALLFFLSECHGLVGLCVKTPWLYLRFASHYALLTGYDLLCYLSFTILELLFFF